MQLIYNNQGAENTSWLDDDLITSAAASIPGVNVDQLLTERNSKRSRTDRDIDQQGVADVVKRDADDLGRQDRQRSGRP